MMESNFGPSQRKPHFVLLIRLPRLPLEMWNGNILRKILKPVGKLCKLDPNSEELYKALFARVCLEVDISKLLKMKIQYIRSGLVYDCLVDYENITTIFYGYGSQNHKFDACSLNSKSMAFELKDCRNNFKQRAFIAI